MAAEHEGQTTEPDRAELALKLLKEIDFKLADAQIKRGLTHDEAVQAYNIGTMVWELTQRIERRIKK